MQKYRYILVLEVHIYIYVCRYIYTAIHVCIGMCVDANYNYSIIIGFSVCYFCCTRIFYLMNKRECTENGYFLYTLIFNNIF